jgi:cell division protein FtsW
LLILGGRDLGTAVAVIAIAAAIFWTAGVPTRYFALGGALFAAFFGLAVAIDPYRIKRLFIFLDPESDPQGAGFQIIQSKIAVGSGGWLGQGLMLGRQKMRFLPEAHNDFIFGVIAEELGLIGCLLVVLAFAVILWRGLRAARRAPDDFGCYLATGATAMIVCQAMINIGVVLGMLPTKGMPLPFISYGGSSMIVSLAAAGLLLNVSQRAQ